MKCFSAQLTGLSISSTGYSQIHAYKMCFCLVQHEISGNTFSLRFPAEFTLRRTKADYIHNANKTSHTNVHALQKSIMVVQIVTTLIFTTMWKRDIIHAPKNI